ncbi:MAG: imidazole glycerol phosphate synthase subunit HisH [Planctomycetota bacterium]
MIGIVDYGMGNLRSVQKAVARVSPGVACAVVGTADEVGGCDGLILPGVGAFGDGMRQLDERGLSDAVRGFAGSGRAVLGVCLGMQLLFDSSTEGAGGGDDEVAGLGLIGGRVVALEPVRGGVAVKVPHMGWNALSWSGGAGEGDALLEGLEPGCWVYFVHGYRAEVAEPADVVATADYGGAVVAVVRRGNVWGTQFHPEKSQAVGLAMLGNFVGLVERGVAAGAGR